MKPVQVLQGVLTEDLILQAFEKIRSDPTFSVEGCHYELARDDRRHQQLAAFVRDHFMPDEPMNRSIGTPWNSEIEGFFISEIQKNMSLMLIDDSSDEVVACRVTNLAEKSEQFLDELKNTKTEQIKIIIDLINHLKSLCDTLSHYDVENAVHFLALGVHKDYRRRGIGGKVMSAAVEIVRQLGLGPVVVTGEGTSNYSKSIYEKLGFETNAEVIYDEYKVNGELVFKNMGDQKSIRLYGKIVS